MPKPITDDEKPSTKGGGPTSLLTQASKRNAKVAGEPVAQIRMRQVDKIVADAHTGNPHDKPTIIESVKVGPGRLSDPDYVDQMVTKVELLMVQGVKAPALLCSTVQHEDGTEVDVGTMRRWIQRVYARWEVSGSASDLRKERGEALANIELLNNKLWVDFQNANDIRDRTWIAGLLMRLLEQRMALWGLTGDNIKQIIMVQEDSEVMTRIRRQNDLSMLASRFADIIAKRRGLQAPVVVEADVSPATLTNRDMAMAARESYKPAKPFTERAAGFSSRTEKGNQTRKPKK